jgi:hypothetical protein
MEREACGPTVLWDCGLIVLWDHGVLVPWAYRTVGLQACGTVER